MSVDSSQRKSLLSKIRQSAGIRSPSSSSMISPTTSSSASITTSFPSRTTFASQVDSFFKFSIALSARYCCKKPTTALSRIIKRRIPVSTSSFLSLVRKASTAERKAASTRIIVIRSLNCAKNSAILLFFLPSRKTFLPFFSSLARASSLERPFALLFVFSSVSSALSVYISIRLTYEKTDGVMITSVGFSALIFRHVTRRSF